jgi:hypothetical protein
MTGRIRSRTYYTCQEVDIEIPIDDVLNDLSDEEIKELYEDTFGIDTRREPASWSILFEKRRTMSDADFLKHIDQVIMDMTGRIL